MLGRILLEFNVADPALDREGIPQDLFLILQVFFLLCWEENGNSTGGGQALVISSQATEWVRFHNFMCSMLELLRGIF